MISNKLTNIETALYSLIGFNVELSCNKYNSKISGTLGKFWIDSWCKDKLNFTIDNGNEIIKHGFNIPEKMKIENEEFKFYIQDKEYIFKVISNKE